MAKVVYVPNKFVSDRYECDVTSLALDGAVREFLAKYGQFSKPIYGKKVAVYHNGVILPREQWAACTLATEDIVEITHTIEGGSFSIGGFIAMSLFVPTPAAISTFMWLGGGWLMDLFDFDYDLDDTGDSQTYDWEGPSTGTSQGRPLAVVYGEHLIGGQYINFNIWSSGNSNYLDALLALCEGEIEGIRDEDNANTCTFPSSLEDATDQYPYIKLNDVFMSAYEEAQWMAASGTNTQSSLPGFKTLQTVYDYSHQIPALRDNPGDRWTLLYTTNADVDEFTLKVKSPSLFSVNSKGKMQTNVCKWRFRYKITTDSTWIYSPTVSGSGVDNADSWHRLEGRSKSEILDSKTIQVGTRGSYHIQAQRYNPASSSLESANRLETTQIVETVHEDLSYPNTAIVAVRLKATDQLSGSFPNINILVRGLKVRVPDLGSSREFQDYYWTGTGYNFLRMSDGGDACTWDGSSYTTQWCNNPAYVIRDFLINTRYGLGDVVESTDLDDASIDTTAFKCWQQQDSTYHMHELNIVFDTQTNPGDALNEMAKVTRIFLFWSTGYIKFKYEEDEDPVQLFNMANIVEGKFSTQYEAQSKIPNLIEIQFANKDDDWKQDTRELVDEAEWALNKPHRKLTISLKGVTNQEQALREAKLALNKAKWKRRAISFTTTMFGMACEPGDIIAFQHDVPQWGWGGRAISGTASTIVLDQEVPSAIVSAPTSYDIKVQHDDDSIETFDILSASGKTVTIDGTFSTIPEEDDLYILGVVDSSIKEYRVKEVTLAAEGTVNITADEHLAAMYTDAGYSIPVSDFSSELPNPAAPAAVVSNLTLYQLPGADVGIGVSFRMPDVGNIGAQITVSDVTNGVCTTSDTESLRAGDYVKFDSGDLNGRLYRVASVVSDTSFTLYDTSVSDSGVPGTCYENDPTLLMTWSRADIYLSTDDLHYVKVGESYGDDDFEISSLLPGIRYYVRVISVNQIGIPNNTTYASSNILLDGSKIGFPRTPTGLEIDDGGVGQGLSTTFNGQDCKWRWKLNAPYGGAGSLEPEMPAGQGAESFGIVKDFVVQIWDPSQTNLLREEITTDRFYTYTYEKNYQDNDSIPRRTFVIKVYQRSYYNKLSERPAVMLVNNPSPDMSSHTPTCTSVYRGVRVDFRAYNVTDNDLDYYKIYYGYQNPPTGSVDHVDWKNQTHTIGGLAQLTKVYVQLEPYDKFGVGTKSVIASARTDGFDFINASSNEWTIKADAIVASIIKNNTITASKFGVEQLSAISADIGTINSGYINGVIITGGMFQTAQSGKRIVITSQGIALSVSANTGGYGNIRYGDNPASNASVLFGSGALAYIHHTSESVPFYISAEQTVGDFHFYNRTSDPTGYAEIGDVCVVNASLKICTVAGLPGTWTTVGIQQGG